MQTSIRLNADGTATGTVQASMKGIPAIAARVLMRKVRGDQEDYLVTKILESQGIHGTGKLQKDVPTELLDVYKFSVSFKAEDLFIVANTTGMPIRPVISGFLPISEFVNDAYDHFEYSSTSIDYKATYRKTGNSLKVKRELWDKTLSNLCSSIS